MGCQPDLYIQVRQYLNLNFNVKKQEVIWKFYDWEITTLIVLNKLLAISDLNMQVAHNTMFFGTHKISHSDNQKTLE